VGIYFDDFIKNQRPKVEIISQKHSVFRELFFGFLIENYAALHS